MKEINSKNCLVFTVLILFLSFPASAKDSLIPQEITWEDNTFIYDPYWKDYESVSSGDFDGDKESEIIVSFMGRVKDGTWHRSFYLIYDVINGKEKLVKTIAGNDYIGEVQIIDLEKDNQKEIAIFSYGGAHSTDFCVYKYEKGIYECIFKNSSAYPIETDFERDKPIIKIGRAKWGTKVLTEDGEEIDWSCASGGHGDCYWQVYVWDGGKFTYDEKLSSTPEISEGEETQRYIDRAREVGGSAARGKI
ncbi:MAG: hypothetical protein KJ915_08985 [Candidatus Omnitrophica bacterium]|nr:hypothetical protein [Candidatus Omnitrophota bacterium]